MAVGVFDSGLGGLTVLDAVTRRLPDVPFVYLGDNAHAPYGVRTADDIFNLTCAAVERLWEEGCDLVILACNTASAKALRSIQQVDLPLWQKDHRRRGVPVRKWKLKMRSNSTFMPIPKLFLEPCSEGQRRSVFGQYPPGGRFLMARDRLVSLEVLSSQTQQATGPRLLFHTKLITSIRVQAGFSRRLAGSSNPTN